MYFPTPRGRVPAGDEFTGTLVDVLHAGVRDGPQALDLVDLCDAVEGAWTALRH